ncbi:hypothetical protein BH10BAC5_BH10BAC5_21500 [soil metagenome]
MEVETPFRQRNRVSLTISVPNRVWDGGKGRVWDGGKGRVWDGGKSRVWDGGKGRHDRFSCHVDYDYHILIFSVRSIFTQLLFTLLPSLPNSVW